MIKQELFYSEPTLKDYREMNIERIIEEFLLTKGTWSHSPFKDEEKQPINQTVTAKSLVMSGLFFYRLKNNPANRKAVEYYCEQWAHINQIIDEHGVITIPVALWKKCDDYNHKMTGM